MHSLSLFHSHGGGHSYTHRAVASYFRVVCEKLQLSRSFTSEKLSHTCMDALLLCIYYSHSSLDISSSIWIVYSLLFLSSGGIEEIVCKLHFHGCVGSELNKATTIKSAELKLELFRRERINAKLYSQILQLNENSQDEKKTHTNCVCVFLSMLIVAINFHSAFRKWFVRVILLNSNNKYSSYQVLDLHVQCALMLCRHALGTHTHTYTPVHSLCILRLGFNSICR